MDIKKPAGILFFVVFIVAGLINPVIGRCENAVERLAYLIKPLGMVECRDSGVTELDGKKAGLLTLRIKVLMLEDVERIYYQPGGALVYRIERDITKLWGKEQVIEEYDQEKFIVTVSLFKKGALVKRKVIKKKGPVYNAILLPLYLSTHPTPDLGLRWHFTERFPGEFKVALVSIDTITVPAGTFQAYHYKSMPEQFEVWISKNEPRMPLKLKGKGRFKYSFLMREWQKLGSN